MLKRIFSVFVAVILCVSLSIAYAADTKSVERSYFSVTMEIVAFDSNTLISSTDIGGHAFLVFYNDGSNAITVGHMRLEPGDFLTIGTFGNRSTHTGIWYNIEAYHNNGNGGSSNTALSMELTEDQLLTVNTRINNSDRWSATNNCAAFAINVWDSVAPSNRQVSGYSPATLQNSMKGITGCYYGAEIEHKDISTIAYQTTRSIVYDSRGANQH